MIINLAFDSYTCTSRKTAMNVKEASKKINQILIEIKVNLTYSNEFIVKNKSGYDQSFIYVMNERDRL